MNNATKMRSRLTSQAAALGVLMLMAGPNAFPATYPTLSCKALVSVSNDLYLVSDDGTPLARFSSDGLDKHFETLSPDGSKVAYILDSRPDGIIITDSDGRSATLLADENHSNGPFVGLQWATDNVLQMNHHFGINNEAFTFFRVVDHLRDGKQIEQIKRPVLNPATGVWCAISPTSHEPVCVSDPDVQVNGRLVYSYLDFDFNKPLELLENLGVGMTVLTQTNPSVQVQVTSLDQGVTLRIISPDGNWEQSRVPSGDIFQVVVDGQRYGFLPTIIDAKRGNVKIAVLEGKVEGTRVLDPTVAWRHDEVAVIELTERGRTLVLLAKRVGGWMPVASGLLPIQQPINSMRFVSPSTLLLQSEQGFAVVTANMPWPIRASGLTTITFGDVITLKNRLDVNVTTPATTTEVLSWSCME